MTTKKANIFDKNLLVEWGESIINLKNAIKDSSFGNIRGGINIGDTEKQSLNFVKCQNCGATKQINTKCDYCGT